MVVPHVNVRASIRALKQAARDFDADDAMMALPEGIILHWFDASENVSPERVQLALAERESDISGALPDPFRFLSAERVSHRWCLRLNRVIDSDVLLNSLRAFASSAKLELCDAPPLYSAEALDCIALGSASEVSLSTPISFKKYELVIYLAELPETPLSGFHFSAIARAHHKTRRGSAGRTLRSD